MSVKGRAEQWRRKRRNRRIVLISVAALIFVGFVIFRATTTNHTTTEPTAAPPSATATTSPTPSFLPVSDKTLLQAADRVLIAYYTSPKKGVLDTTALGKYATPALVDTIASNWQGLESSTHVIVNSKTFYGKPMKRDDGTITLNACVQTATDYGDSLPKEIDDYTAVSTFVVKDGSWLVDAIDEMAGCNADEDS